MSNAAASTRTQRKSNLVSSQKLRAKKSGSSPRTRTAPAGTETRQRILNVATQEFSAKGYDGARVDDIMRTAKVSKNLIYHYFGSKERLFIAVLEAAYQGMHDYHSTWSFDEASPSEGVCKLVRSTFEYWQNSPEFIGLLNSENFHRGRHLRKSKLTKAGYSGLVAKLSQLLKQGETTGEFRPSVDPVELYISISALAYHYLSNRYTLAYLLDRKLSTEEDKKVRISHIESLILGYLREGTGRKR
jgi:TetR/AcrR family transcriptional regulator